MRPTSSTMLQQNNNNNYPCLNVSGSTREMLQKCPRAALPFPSRLELGLGDLPLVRGLRAWALCSKNRRKTGGLPGGGGQAPGAPPLNRGNSTSCLRPADVYPTGEWGSMEYGLPLGVDARQAGIGALVTVATLKTSEGGGKTQTQCLFLRTEKGSCLYSTTRPGACSLGMGPGMTSPGASTLVGGWLRGKVGGGGGGGGGGGRDRDTSARKRDNGPTPPAQTGANRVRMRSGRRWRKSCSTAGSGQERAGLNRERRSKEEASGKLILEERQEEKDKGGFPDNCLGGKQSPSPQEDRRSSRQERRGANRSNASGKTCTQCVRRGQVDEAQRGGVCVLNDEEEDGMRKEEQEKDGEERRRGPAGSKPNLNPETNHLCSESHSRERRRRSKEERGEDVYSENEEDATSQTGERDIAGEAGHCDILHNGAGQTDVTDDFTVRYNRDYSDRNTPSGETSIVDAVKPTQRSSERVMAGVDRVFDSLPLDTELEQETEGLGQVKDKRSDSITLLQSPDVSRCSEEAHLPLSPFSSSSSHFTYYPAQTPEPASPAGGSTSTAQHQAREGQEERENSRDKEHLESSQLVEGDPGVVDIVKELDNQCIHQESDSVYKKELTREERPLEVGNTVFNEPVRKDIQSTPEEDRGPCEDPRETLFVFRKEEEDRQVEEGYTTPSPPPRQEDGPRETFTFQTDRGNLNTAEEEEKRTEKRERRGTDLNGTTEEERRDESAVGNRGEEMERENVAEGERVEPEEGDGTEEVWRKRSKALQDGGFKRDQEMEINTEEKSDKLPREDNQDFKRHDMTEADGAQEEEWRTEGRDTPQLSVPLVEERGRGEGRRGVGNEEKCSPLLLASVADPESACGPENGETCSSPSNTHSLANPAPLPPGGVMATGLPRLEADGAAERRTGAGGREGGGEGVGAWLVNPEERRRDTERGCTLATGLQETRTRRREEEEEGEREEEDEFGVFMQAEGEPAWSEGFTMSASVPCGNREKIEESNHWTSVWTDSSFHHSEETWAAFPQDSFDEGGDTVGQWWPISAVEGRRDRLSANQNLTAVFTKAFPTLPGLATCDPGDPGDPGDPSDPGGLDAVPTLTQLLRRDQHHTWTSQEQGLLDNFHDLNKMIGQRYKRANGVSRDRLLKTLRLDHTSTESRTVPRTANHRLSPGLPSANQHTQNAAAKRRLSYDYNRNIMD